LSGGLATLCCVDAVESVDGVADVGVSHLCHLQWT